MHMMLIPTYGSLNNQHVDHADDVGNQQPANQHAMLARLITIK